MNLSKVLPDELHYDCIKSKCGKNSRLLFTDTDSLMYEIKTEDVYEDFIEDKKTSDFSNYSLKSKYYNDSNKLTVCKMDDEAADVFLIKEVFGLRKIYIRIW